MRKAPFRGFDFETLQTLKGNPSLGQTSIDNVDLKLEHYPTLGEMISAGVFYKHFNAPIEQTQVIEAVNEELTWSNVPSPMWWAWSLTPKRPGQCDQRPLLQETCPFLAM